MVALMSPTPPAPDDQWGDLMKAAQDGDQAAYCRLLIAITPYIRSAVRQQWADGAEGVEDVAQEVLMSVHLARNTYDPSRAFRPWLSSLVRHRLADRARRYYRRTRYETAVEILPETSATDGAKELQEDRDDFEWMMAEIEKLPQGQRQAVQLLRLEELSLKEASAKSGQSIAALKVAMHRAAKALARAFERDGQ